jgi:hypothetical protein
LDYGRYKKDTIQLPACNLSHREKAAYSPDPKGKASPGDPLVGLLCLQTFSATEPDDQPVDPGAFSRYERAGQQTG